MSIGNGEYLIISTCLKCPYDVSSISLLLKEMSYCIKTKFKEATFLKISPQEVTYELIWNGEIEEFSCKKFSIDKLENYFLSSLDIEFNEDVIGRLQVSLFDETCYEVSMIFNYTQLIDEESSEETRMKNAIWIENIGLLVFKILEPILGKICVESSIGSVNSIIHNEESLPTDKAFYSKNFFDKHPGLVNSLINNACFVKVIKDVGIYFRKGKEEDFIIKKNENIMFDEIFSKVVDVLKTIIKI